jgi:hypothetical protein
MVSLTVSPTSAYSVGPGRASFANSMRRSRLQSGLNAGLFSSARVVALATAGLARPGLRVHVYSTVFDSITPPARASNKASPASTLVVILCGGLGNVVIMPVVPDGWLRWKIEELEKMLSAISVAHYFPFFFAVKKSFV